MGWDFTILCSVWLDSSWNHSSTTSLLGRRISFRVFCPVLLRRPGLWQWPMNPSFIPILGEDVISLSFCFPFSRAATYGPLFFLTSQELMTALHTHVTSSFLSRQFSIVFFLFFSPLLLPLSNFGSDQHHIPQQLKRLQHLYTRTMGLLPQHLPTTALVSSWIPVAAELSFNWASSPLFSLHLLIHASKRATRSDH